MVREVLHTWGERNVMSGWKVIGKLATTYTLRRYPDVFFPRFSKNECVAFVGHRIPPRSEGVLDSLCLTNNPLITVSGNVPSKYNLLIYSRWSARWPELGKSDPHVWKVCSSFRWWEVGPLLPLSFYLLHSLRMEISVSALHPERSLAVNLKSFVSWKQKEEW